MGGPLAGYIAAQAGYDDGNTEICNRENGESLALGMFWVMTVPWTICACCFGLLHFTYPADRRKVLTRLEREQAEEDAARGGSGGATEHTGKERRPLPSPLAPAESCFARCRRHPYAALNDEDDGAEMQGKEGLRGPVGEKSPARI